MTDSRPVADPLRPAIVDLELNLNLQPNSQTVAYIEKLELIVAELVPGDAALMTLSTLLADAEKTKSERLQLAELVDRAVISRQA